MRKMCVLRLTSYVHLAFISVFTEPTLMFTRFKVKVQALRMGFQKTLKPQMLEKRRAVSWPDLKQISGVRAN